MGGERLIRGALHRQRQRVQSKFGEGDGIPLGWRVEHVWEMSGGRSVEVAWAGSRTPLVPAEESALGVPRHWEPSEVFN